MCVFIMVQHEISRGREEEIYLCVCVYMYG